MKKFGKMSVIAAFTLALTLLASVVTPSFANAADENTTSGGFVSNAVEIAGENESLSGWQYYFNNSTAGVHYHSNELFVRATENGRTGNAMELERKTADGELVIYSYLIKVEPSASYKISSFVKIAESSGKLTYCVKEQDSNGDATNDENAVLNTIEGVKNEWTETSFTYNTTATAATIVLRIKAEGVGIIDIDDLTVEKVYANTISYRMMAIGNDGSSENPATYNEVSASNLSDDSSDGDGKSLLLKDHDVFMPSFGMLPHGVNYRLSFKYKRVTETGGERLSIYIDNMTPAIERSCYADGVSGGSTTEWTSYSYDFNAKAGQTDITFMRIASYGSYLIDELEINTLNEYVLNGSFENTNYYGRFAIEDAGVSTGVTVDNTVLENGNRTLKIEGGKIAYLRYSMILPKNTRYNLSFRYKKISDSEKSAHGSTNKGILITTDGYKTDNSQFWDLGWQNSSNNNEWVDFSYDFLSLGDGTSDIQYIRLWACYGDYLIDDLSVKCVDDTFADVQYVINGNFGGAYIDGYEFYGTSNFGFAKQSDGNFAFGSVHTTWHVGSGARGYFRIKTDMLEKGKEYALSFDYYTDGSGVEVLGVYNGNASGSEKEFVSLWSATNEWTHYEATFTAGQFNQNFLEMYGPSGEQKSTFIKNIQITDKSTGETFITNQSLVAPDGGSTTIYKADFGTGNAEYTWNDWTIENGGIYGLTFEDGNKDYKICLDGSADKTATAISKDIDVTGINVLKIEQKIYYFGGNLAVTVLAGDKEITADSNGYFILPEGTTSIRVKYAANEYVTFKKVFVNTHAHGEECKNVTGEQTNVYEFSADNTTCTATRYYACGAVVKTEKVNTVLSGDTATFTETGTATCTATFADSDFETQTKTVETPMKETPEVGMKVGASMRTNEPYGIRWTAKIRTADWNKLVTLYGEENVKAGVLVAPFDYVKNGDTVTELTVEAFKAAGLNYVDIVTDTFNAKAGEGMEGYNAFYASLVNIQTANLNRKFIARAYIAVENDGVTTYYYGEYSEENQARSIYEISKKVIVSDTESEATKQFAETGVLDKVVEVTVENGEATLATIDGYESPYTATLEDGVLTISVTNAESGANISNIGIVCVNGKNYKPTVSGDVVTVSIN